MGKYANNIIIKMAQVDTETTMRSMREGGHDPATINIAGHYIGGSNGRHSSVEDAWCSMGREATPRGAIGTGVVGRRRWCTAGRGGGTTSSGKTRR